MDFIDLYTQDNCRSTMISDNKGYRMIFVTIRNLRHAVLIVVSFTIFSFPSSAGSESVADSKRIFEIVDINKDGLVDRIEYRLNKMDALFIRDQNRDRHLSRKELSNMSAATFSAVDKDGDNLISGYEFNQADISKFEAVDLNNDGSITFDEFVAFRKIMR